MSCKLVFVYHKVIVRSRDVFCGRNTRSYFLLVLLRWRSCFGEMVTSKKGALNGLSGAQLVQPLILNKKGKAFLLSSKIYSLLVVRISLPPGSQAAPGRRRPVIRHIINPEKCLASSAQHDGEYRLLNN